MTLKTEKFIRKVRPVDAVKVTEENLSEIAGWCNGLVVPAPGLNGENTTKPYIFVTVRNARKESDSKAFPDMWIVREDFRNYRVVNNKQFKNSYDPISKPAVTPKAMPAKRTEPKDPSGLTEATPEPVDVSGGAVEVEINRDAGSGQFVSDEYTEANPATTVTETINKEINLQSDEFNHDATGDNELASEQVADDLTLDVVVPGDMVDSTQPEEDEDGTVQLGVPVETPSLCGSCGHQVVDGVCSNDADHNVNATAEEVASIPRIVPGD